MASIDLIQKEATKFSIISLAVACMLVAQILIGMIISMLNLQNTIAILIVQLILPLAILAMNGYALIFSLRYPEYDRKLPAIGLVISLVAVVYLIISFVITF